MSKNINESDTRITKRQVRFFSVVDWEKEEEFLRKQHNEGWRFVSFHGSHFVFEKCEPEDMVYQLDFKGDEQDMEEYIQMFRDCGWEYIQDMFGWSYFRKPAAEMKENEEGIFCDNESRLDMLQTVYRKKVLPLVCIFFSVVIPQLVMQSVHASVGDVGAPFAKWLSVAFMIIFVLYLVIFIKFGLTLRRFKKKRGK